MFYVCTSIHMFFFLVPFFPHLTSSLSYYPLYHSFSSLVFLFFLSVSSNTFIFIFRSFFLLTFYNFPPSFHHCSVFFLPVTTGTLFYSLVPNMRMICSLIHLQFSYLFVYIMSGLECVGHNFAYAAHFVFLRDVWIQTQRAAAATNLSMHPSPLHFFSSPLCSYRYRFFFSPSIKRFFVSFPFHVRHLSHILISCLSLCPTNLSQRSFLMWMKSFLQLLRLSVVTGRILPAFPLSLGLSVAGGILPEFAEQRSMICKDDISAVGFFQQY